VHSIATGDDIGHDTLGGYIGNLNEQVQILLLLSPQIAQADLRLQSAFSQTMGIYDLTDSASSGGSSL